MLFLVWLFFIFTSTQAYSYLDNNASTLEWIDIPKNSILNKRVYPYTGFGCTVYNKNNDLYFVSSTYPGRYLYNNNQYCATSKKNVEILKYSFTVNNFTNTLLVGDATGFWLWVNYSLGTVMSLIAIGFWIFYRR